MSQRGQGSCDLKDLSQNIINPDTMASNDRKYWYGRKPFSVFTKLDAGGCFSV